MRSFRRAGAAQKIGSTFDEKQLTAEQLEQVNAIRPLIDTDFYLRAYPDVAEAGVDPVIHFYLHGWREGRDPSAGFSTADYLAAHPEVAAAGINPLQADLRGLPEVSAVGGAEADEVPDEMVPSEEEVAAQKAREEAAALEAALEIIRPHFDVDYYLARNPDVQEAWEDPVAHYYLHGWRERRNPSREFSTWVYLLENPDIAATGENPFLHYIREGRAAGRRALLRADHTEEETKAHIEEIRGEFDAEYYLERYPDVSSSQTDPVDHYYRLGWHEGRDPNADFSTNYYLAENPHVAGFRVNPFWHYVTSGRNQGLLPRPPQPELEDRIAYEANVLRPRFNVGFYLKRYPDVSLLGVDPVVHYCLWGWQEGRDPAPDFSTLFYLKTHGDVAAAEINPFWHFLVDGEKGGRESRPAGHEEPEPEAPADLQESWPAVEAVSEEEQPVGDMEDLRDAFDAEFYLARYPDVRGRGIDPLEHYWTIGWKEGRDPAFDFSTRHYIETNPDIAARAHLMNPFWHYVMAGRAEGRAGRHPGGYRVERLRHTEPLEQNVRHWIRKTEPGPLMDASDIKGMIFAQCPEADCPLHIAIGHDNYLKVSGGVQLCIHREEQLSNAIGANYLDVHPWQPLPRLAHLEDDPDPIMDLILNGTEIGRTRISDLIKAVSQSRDDLGPIRVVIHHLLGHLPERVTELVAATGKRDCWLWLHDFFTTCTSYSLQRNGVSFCGAPSEGSNACALCRFGQERATHLPRMRAMFDALDIHVVAPSQVTMDLWAARSGLKAASQVVQPHMKISWHKRSEPINAPEPETITIGFLGTPAAHKGWDVFEALALHLRANKRYRFVYFGSAPSPLASIAHVPVHVTADAPDAMIEAVARVRCDLVLHWASWPETFSFSTFEAFVGGAWVITNPGSGNVAAKVTSLKRGAVIESEEALLDFFDDGFAERMVARLRAERAEKSVHHKLSDMILQQWTAKKKKKRKGRKS